MKRREKCFCCTCAATESVCQLKVPLYRKLNIGSSFFSSFPTLRLFTFLDVFTDLSVTRVAEGDHLRLRRDPERSGRPGAQGGGLEMASSYSVNFTIKATPPLSQFCLILCLLNSHYSNIKILRLEKPLHLTCDLPSAPRGLVGWIGQVYRGVNKSRKAKQLAQVR